MSLNRLAAAALLLLGLTCVAGAKPVPSTPGPAWKMKDVDGKVVSSADFKGKVVVVDFWATWCPPCRTEIPGYVALQKKYGADGLVFVGISVDGDDSIPAVKAFVKQFNINYVIVMANDTIQDQFHVNQGYPTTFIIDRDGNIRNKKVGREPTAVFEKEMLPFLRPPGSRDGAGLAITP
jgi:thiol-disulfide isomerase/thioredoxin